MKRLFAEVVVSGVGKNGRRLQRVYREFVGVRSHWQRSAEREFSRQESIIVLRHEKFRRHASFCRYGKKYDVMCPACADSGAPLTTRKEEA